VQPTFRLGHLKMIEREAPDEELDVLENLEGQIEKGFSYIEYIGLSFERRRKKQVK